MNASTIRDFFWFLASAEPEFDYSYIGPGRNDIPWFDLFVIGFCIFAIGVVIHGVIVRARD